MHRAFVGLPFQLVSFSHCTSAAIAHASDSTRQATRFVNAWRSGEKQPLGGTPSAQLLVGWLVPVEGSSLSHAWLWQVSTFSLMYALMALFPYLIFPLPFPPPLDGRLLDWSMCVVRECASFLFSLACGALELRRL